jgi:hypothetical protein
MLLLAEQVILGQKTAGGGRLGVENSSSSSLSLGVVSREKSRVDAPPCSGGRWDAEVRWEEGVAMLFSLWLMTVRGANLGEDLEEALEYVLGRRIGDSAVLGLSSKPIEVGEAWNLLNEDSVVDPLFPVIRGGLASVWACLALLGDWRERPCRVMKVVSTWAGDSSSSFREEESIEVSTSVAVAEVSIAAPRNPVFVCVFIIDLRSGVETVLWTAATSGTCFIFESLDATEDAADSLIECARRLRILASGSEATFFTGCLGCNRKALWGGPFVVVGGRGRAETRGLAENSVAALVGTGGLWTTISLMGRLCLAVIPQPRGEKERESGENWKFGTGDGFSPTGWSFWLLGIMVYIVRASACVNAKTRKKGKHMNLTM